MSSFRSNEETDSSAINAKTEAQTTASGSNTNGILNQHPSENSTENSTSSSLSKLLPFRVGIAEDRNKRWRRSMEDSYAFVYDFGSVYGQGFFGIFDGHAGKHAAEWCGLHFHKYLLDTLITLPNESVPDIFNKTYHAVDKQLGEMADKMGTSSGCTAVTVLLRLESQDGKPAAHKSTGGMNKKSRHDLKSLAFSEGGEGENMKESTSSSSDGNGGGGGLFRSISKRLRSPSNQDNVGEEETNSSIEKTNKRISKDENSQEEINTTIGTNGLVEVSGKNLRRVLYTANVGDARAVLCRNGKAVRLTYDHKGSDAQEAKRIMDAGGFVMNNRVNGVLAVTRSLGDSAMKEFVVGSPYTTETTLSEQDTFLIVACDGLWDVTDDQDAVDLVKNEKDPQEAASKLLSSALQSFSTDNLSVMVIRFAYDGSSVSTGKATTSGGGQEKEQE